MFSSKWPRRYLAIFYLFFLTVGCEYILLSPQMLAYADSQQGMTLLGVGYTNSAPSVTPGLVNFSGMPSVENPAANPFSGTQTFTGTGNCPTKTYCAPVGGPQLSSGGVVSQGSLASNKLVIPYTYTEASADTPTIATYTGNPSSGYTATGDTITSCGTEAHVGTIFFGCFYVATATTATVQARLTFTGAPTYVAVGAGQWYNAGALDGYATNTASVATTSWNTGSVTSTANNDLYFSCAIGTTTRTNVSAFTQGASFTLDLNDQRDAIICQEQVQTSSGALNPAITAGTSNTYAGFTVAFKAASQGTAPSGEYAAHIYRVNSATGSSNLSYSVPIFANGDTIAAAVNGGGAGPQLITAVSDGTNGSWQNCEPEYPGYPASFNTTGGSYFFANATAPTGGSLAVTMTVSGTGDTGPATFYDLVGAAKTQNCPYQQTLQNNGAAAAATTFTSNAAFTPALAAGIVIASGSVNINTALGATAGQQDCATVGGQDLAGPSLPDENNGCSSWAFTAATPTDIKWQWLDPTSQSNGVYGAMVFAPATGSPTSYPAVVQYAQNHATSAGTSLTVTSFAPKSGDTLVVETGVFNITTGTFGCSDPTNGTYTVVHAAANATNGPWRGASFIKSNVAATTVTITCTFGTSNTQRSMFVFEVQGNRSVDQSTALTNVTSGTGGIVQQSVTTTHANETVISMALCAIVCDGWTATNTASWNQPFTQPGVGDSFGDSAAFLNTGATGTFTTTATDSGGTGHAEAVETVSVF